MIGRAQTDSSENKVRLYLRRRPLPCIILCRSFERLVLTFIIAPLPHLFLLLLFSIRPMRAVRGFFITLQQESRELITEDHTQYMGCEDSHVTQAPAERLSRCGVELTKVFYVVLIVETLSLSLVQ